MRILVTGASGFIGKAMLRAAAGRPGIHARAAVRRAETNPSPCVEYVQVGDLLPDTDWTHAVQGVDVIVHTAARVHVMREHAADPLAEYRRVNVAGTMSLARQAIGAGVKRLVFISSIGVNGAETSTTPFTADDAPAPHSAYAHSKHEAELGLQELARKHGMEVVIIRPPLVYGPGAPGNFRELLRYISLRIPLPLGAVRNRRSLVAIGNLVDLILTCTHHPAAANRVLLASDGQDLSTAELLRALGEIIGKPARLIPVPVALLRAGAALLGKQELARRLCGSLQVDSAPTRRLLCWSPPVTVAEGLRAAVEGLH